MSGLPENQSQENIERFPDIFQAAPVAMCEVDYINQRFLHVNELMCRLSGYGESELLSMRISDLFEGEDLQRFQERITKGILGQKIDDSVEYKLKAKDGNYIYALISVKPTYKEGKLVSALVTGIDITERKKAEDDLKISETRLQRIAQAGHIGLFEYNATKDTAYWSSQHYELLGYPIGSKVTYERWLQGVHPEDRERVANNFAKLNKEVCAVGELEGKDNYRYNRSDGSTIWIESGLSLKIVNREKLIQGYIQDVTERKKAEEALQNSEKQKNDILESITDGFVAFDKEWRYTYANSNAARILHTPKEELIGKVAIDVFPNASKFLAEFKRAVSSGRAVHFEEYYPEPLNIWYECHCYPSEEGLTVFFSDITQRKKAEEALKQNQELISKQLEEINSYYDNAPIGLAILDKELRYIRVNKLLAEINGMPAEEHVGKTIREVVPALAEQAEEIPRKIIESGKAVYNIEFSGETTACPGEKRTWRESWIPIKDSLGEVTALYVMAEDITERKKATEALERYQNNLEKLVEERTNQLKDAERLAAIGATAGMVGHDIRNPLQAMTGDIYLLKDSIGELPNNEAKKGMLEDLDALEQNLFYIDKIVGDLQDFVRPLNPRSITTNIEQLIKSQISRFVPRKIKTTLKIDPEVQMLKTDPDILKRILMNLLTNAVQAMPVGGKLTVAAKKMGNCYVLSVEDTGVGIPEAVKPKLFTPMFTTKSKGQGFGLPVIKRMTEALGGTVTFESEEGKGTKFIIEFPIH